MARETYTINCIIKHETDKAILVEYNGDNYWIPLSTIDRISRGDSRDEITMTAWIANKLELI